MNPDGVTLKFRYTGEAAAKAALDMLRSDVRHEARRAIHVLAARQAVLEITLCRPVDEISGIAKVLAFAGGKLVSVEAADRQLADRVRHRLSGV